MNYISIIIIFVTILILYCVLKTTEFFPLPCVDNIENCKTYKSLVVSIMGYLYDIEFNILLNLDLKNYLKSSYDEAVDDSKINFVKQEIIKLINKPNKIDLNANQDIKHEIKNPLFQFSIFKPFEKEFSSKLPKEIETERKTKIKEIEKLVEDNELSISDKDKLENELINCALECIRTSLNEFVDEQIPEINDIKDLNESVPLILAYQIVNNDAFSGKYNFEPIELNTNNKFDSFKQMLKRRDTMLQNIVQKLSE